MAYEIDKIKNNVHKQIQFGLPNGTVKAYMIQENFSIEASANYESVFQQSLAETLASQNQVASKVLELGKKALQTSAKNVEETRLSWVNSEKPKFNLDLLFVSIESGDDPRKHPLQFLEGVMPTRGTANIMNAPWDYNILGEGTNSGKFAVQIGKWFRAPNQVLTGARFNLSREVVDIGGGFTVPLYVEGSVSFEPWKMIFADQLSGYFPGVR